MAKLMDLVSSAEISIMMPVLRKGKMNNRDDDLETAHVNFKIPSFDL